ncbi:MAG TPA: serine/threonine-protein kinase, partial [Kofleriaceae bacterium]|nr:serine/threonine-protein kinase [Kofleriaceae bacterium]
MEAARPAQLAPGTMLDDKYRIERLLAEGGMGAVYEGTHVGIRKRVAIKVINPQLSTPAMLERFHREAITASQIGHEGIVQTTDLGTSRDGEPFLVMELLEGESLAGRLKAHGRMPIDAACELACAILSPLAAAHQAGIVHRDLKPDNVFLVRQSRGEVIKILDFGISRAAGLDGDFRLTTTGLVLGTPFYMSPEQARGDSSITYAADLYAVGVILYEMLIGKVPISAENYNQLMYRVMTGEFEWPRAIRPEVPVELEQVILHTMALDPANRPASAAALEQALLAIGRTTEREHVLERISLSGPFLRPTPMPSRTQRASSVTGHGAIVPGHRRGPLRARRHRRGPQERPAHRDALEHVLAIGRATEREQLLLERRRARGPIRGVERHGVQDHLLELDGDLGADRAGPLE